MKLLRECIRELLIETPVTKSEIEDAIQDASFNSSQSSSHRWSRGQPMIDYYFDDAAGSWKFQAAFPDGTANANNWPTFPKDKWSSERIEVFLSHVEETPQQLKLSLEEAVEN